MKIICRVTLAIAFVVNSLMAFDQQTFYRAPFFQSDPTPKTKSWTTSLDVRIAHGETRDAYDIHGHTTSLLNAYAAVDVTKLGLGLDDFKKTITENHYWDVTNTGDWDPNQVGTLGVNDGKVQYFGRFKINEYDLTLQQNLFWGLYAHVYLPIKELRLDQITYKNLGTATIHGKSVDTFLTTHLPAILTEFGFRPLQNRYKKTGVGDLVCSLGWQGYKEGLKGLVTGYAGLAQLGIVIPTATKVDQNIVFAVPLGYEGHVGFTGRLTVEGCLWNMVTLGAQAGTTIFSGNDKYLRMNTDKRQTGWIALERGYANEDLGQLWDAGGYVKFDRLLSGFVALLGYSYTQQERTWLNVKDNYFLSRIVNDAIASNNDNGSRQLTGYNHAAYIDKNDYVNSTKRRDGWVTQTLHIMVGYDAMVHLKKMWGPYIKLEYDYPLAGRYSWKADMISGVLGASVTWNF